jgi:hypothetical protein
VAGAGFQVGKVVVAAVSPAERFDRRVRNKRSPKINRLPRSLITPTPRDHEQGSSFSVFHFINVPNHLRPQAVNPEASGQPPSIQIRH